MKTQEIKGKHILLLGYGRENQSVHRFLLANYPEVTITIADKNPGSGLRKTGSGLNVPQGLTPIQHFGSDYLSHLKNYDTVIRSPGIPCHTREIQDYIKKGCHVTTATNIFFSLCQGMTIGVTGTKGKSTTSALIAHILADSRNRGAFPPAGREGIPGISKESKPDVRLVGNIGNPMLDTFIPDSRNRGAFPPAGREGIPGIKRVVANFSSRPPLYVIELSSHQLEDCRYSPHIAVVLNVFPEHMDYYKTFDQYVDAKTNIVAFQTRKDMVIYDDSNTTAAAIAQTSKGQKIPISLYRNTPIPKTNLFGNEKNIHAALAVSYVLRIPARVAHQALLMFRPLSHRLEYVGKFKGITFYNDSLATIPEATIHAIESLGDDVATLIAGGFDRGLDYMELGAFLAKQKTLKTLILFPDTGIKIQNAILSADPMSHVSCIMSQTMQDAISLAYQHTPSGKICLLSPASASFNLFKDYTDRGEQFKKWVEKLL